MYILEQKDTNYHNVAWTLICYWLRTINQSRESYLVAVTSSSEWKMIGGWFLCFMLNNRLAGIPSKTWNVKDKNRSPVIIYMQCNKRADYFYSNFFFLVNTDLDRLTYNLLRIIFFNLISERGKFYHN